MMQSGHELLECELTQMDELKFQYQGATATSRIRDKKVFYAKFAIQIEGFGIV